MVQSASMSWSGRGTALLVAVACAAPLLVAAWLSPSASGMGTHRQLGLPACTWPGMFGLPCVTCGMTTSFALSVRGTPVEAAWAQPAGLVLSVSAAVGVVVGAWSAASGRPVHRFLLPLARPRTAWWAAGILLAAWAWKITVTRGAA